MSDRHDDVPPPRVGEVAVAGLAAGLRLGSYYVVRRIGGGGTGTVYEARQEQPQRRVALKTLNPGLLSAASLARFQVEVEALAALRHPGIARVYETGTHTPEGNEQPEGIPWLAMEYVEGARPLLDFAREHELGPRARLRLLLRVCEAVEHGHRKGVVHRNLNPDNLLVDPEGGVKVIDFGVARFLDADRVRAALGANAVEMLGTLPYLSPEQLAGTSAEVDTRTDVYALGVVGYELLLGRLPIDVRGQRVGRSRRDIEEQGPVRPSRHAPELEGGVEAILLKALAKEPDRRYGGVSALADDVRRYLADEPVLAHAQSAGYKLRLFAHRHQLFVGAMIAVLLALISGAVVSYQHARRSEDAEQAANQRAAAAQAELGRARLVLEQLLERGTQGNMDVAPAVQKLRGGSAIAGSLMRHTLQDLQLVERMSGSDPRIRVALASAYVRFGEAAGSPSDPNLGDLAGANQSFAHAWELVEPILAANPTHPPARWVAMRALQKRGEVLLAQGERDQGTQLLQQALQVAEGLHRDVPDQPSFEAGLAAIHDRLGAAYAQAGEDERSEEHRAKSRAGFARLVQQAPAVPQYRHHHALGFQQAAAAAWSRGEYAAARDGFAQAAYLLEPLVLQHGQDRRHLESLAWNVTWTGNAEQKLGHLDVARKRYESALGLYRSLSEAEPGNRELPPHVGNALWDLGMLAEERAQAADTEPEARRRHLEAALGWFEEAEAHVVHQLEDDGDPRQAQLLQIVRRRTATLRARLEREGPR